MDTVQQILNRYHSDVLRTAVASVFVLYLSYKYFALIPFDLLFKFSAVERFALFFLLAFVAGKIVATLGSMLVNALIWVAFQHNKQEWWDEFMKDFTVNVPFGRKTLKRDLAVNEADRHVFMNQNPPLDRLYGSHLNIQQFWYAILGFSLIAMFFHNSLWELEIVAAIFVFSIFKAIHSRLLFRKFRTDCSLLTIEMRKSRSS